MTGIAQSLPSEYEAASKDTAEAIFGWFKRHDMESYAAMGVAAWNDGSIEAEFKALQPEPQVTTVAPVRRAVLDSKNAESRARGYSGDPCPRCQALTLRVSGHCMVCDSCGETTGCS